MDYRILNVRIDHSYACIYTQGLVNVVQLCVLEYGWKCTQHYPSAGKYTTQENKPKLKPVLSLAGNLSELFPRILCLVHTAVALCEEGVPQLSHCGHFTDALHCPGQLH